MRCVFLLALYFFRARVSSKTKCDYSVDASTFQFWRVILKFNSLRPKIRSKHYLAERLFWLLVLASGYVWWLRSWLLNCQIFNDMPYFAFTTICANRWWGGLDVLVSSGYSIMNRPSRTDLSFHTDTARHCDKMHNTFSVLHFGNLFSIFWVSFFFVISYFGSQFFSLLKMRDLETAYLTWKQIYCLLMG